METIDRCPHCGDDAGYRLRSKIVGHSVQEIGFDGEVLDMDQNTTYIDDSFGECLSCEGDIESEKLLR